jgi:hypothetical protein
MNRIFAIVLILLLLPIHALARDLNSFVLGVDVSNPNTGDSAAAGIMISSDSVTMLFYSTSSNRSSNPGKGIIEVDELLILGDMIVAGPATFEDDVEMQGDLTFVGDATVWDDLRVPAQNTIINPTKSEPAFEEFTDGLFVYKFDTTNADDESVHFVAQMPHAYKEGSDIGPHLHWSPDTSNTGNVRWQLEYVIANIDNTFDTTATSETITVAAGGTALFHEYDEFSDIDGTGLTISHIIMCRLTRLSTSDVLDTFTGNAAFLEFDFHYEIDTVGSREILDK